MSRFRGDGEAREAAGLGGTLCPDIYVLGGSVHCLPIGDWGFLLCIELAGNLIVTTRLRRGAFQSPRVLSRNDFGQEIQDSDTASTRRRQEGTFVLVSMDEEQVYECT